MSGDRPSWGKDTVPAKETSFPPGHLNWRIIEDSLSCLAFSYKPTKLKSWLLIQVQVQPPWQQALMIPRTECPLVISRWSVSRKNCKWVFQGSLSLTCTLDIRSPKSFVLYTFTQRAGAKDLRLGVDFSLARVWWPEFGYFRPWIAARITLCNAQTSLSGALASSMSVKSLWYLHQWGINRDWRLSCACRLKLLL